MGTRARLLVISFDLASAVFLAALYVALLAKPALAYVDPSVMTYAIQAIAGVAVALSAVFGVAWRKSRKKLFNLLGIDENAGKEVEGPIHRVDPSKQAQETGAASETTHPAAGRHGRQGRGTARGEQGTRTAGPLAWKRRFGYALLFVTGAVFTVCVVPPFEIVGANQDSLVYGLAQIWWVIALFALVVIVVVALALSALRDNAFRVAMSVLASIMLAAYIQALLLNRSLPVADGSTVEWSEHAAAMWISAIVWIALIAIPLIASRRNIVRWLKPLAAFVVVLTVIQGVGVASLFTKVAKAADTVTDAEKTYVTETGLFSLSDKRNVVVFVLDTFDTRDLAQILSQDPDCLDGMTDFTFFENSTGSMIPTRYAVPFLLTDKLPAEGQSYLDYYKNRYSEGTFLDDIHDAGYSIGIYSDSIGLEDAPAEVARKVEGETINLHPIDDPNVDIPGTILELEKAAMYRDAPWVAKPLFWYYTDELNVGMVSTDSNGSLDQVQYLMNDAGFYETLQKRGIALDDGGDAGAFRFIHLEGAHYPYVMDADGEPAAGTSTKEEQEKGSLRIVLYYLSCLKDLGIYDDTTVIVTADHGEWYITPDQIDRPTSPIILVKPAKTSAEAGTPFEVSDMPISHVDIAPTIIDAIGGDTSSYGSTVFDIDDPARVRYYIMTASNGRHDTALKQYEISGDALDFSNWRLSGVTWDIKPQGDDDSSGHDADKVDKDHGDSDVGDHDGDHGDSDGDHDKDRGDSDGDHDR